MNISKTNLFLKATYKSKDDLKHNEAKLTHPVAIQKKYKKLIQNNKPLEEHTPQDKDQYETKYYMEYSNIETLKDLEKNLMVDNHIYELLQNNTNKIYFDIDYKDNCELHDAEQTREQTDKFLDRFKGILETELKIKIHPDDFIILTNENKNKLGQSSDKIHSLHIIINSYKMDWKQQQKLTNYINFKHNLKLDPAVYGVDKIFRMINQTKQQTNIKLVSYYGEIKPLKNRLSLM